MIVTVYRIGYAGATTADEHAFGSTLAEGRWHTRRHAPRPRRVIYAAASRALAQLEKRVHANGSAPVNQALFALRFENIKIESAFKRGLAANWRDDEAVSKQFGDAWLDAQGALAIWVPSFVEPLEQNILINPDHRDISKLSYLVERNPFQFDPRLGRGRDE